MNVKALIKERVHENKSMQHHTVGSATEKIKVTCFPKNVKLRNGYKKTTMHIKNKPQVISNHIHFADLFTDDIISVHCHLCSTPI